MSVIVGLDRPVAIVDYDVDWPGLYELERERLNSGLGDIALHYEHIGSTSVPGLAARPVLDIAVGLRRLEDAEICIPALHTLGYTYNPNFKAASSERRFFWRWAPEVHMHHLYLVPVNSSLWLKPILFRDYLRCHPYEALWYGAVKRALAEQCGDDIEAYRRGKTVFMESILLKAQQGGELVVA